MAQDGNHLSIAPEKREAFAMDKFLRVQIGPGKNHSILAWAGLYFEIHVAGAPEKTQQSKKRDLTRFLEFYMKEVGHDQVDGWTPAVSRHFQDQLMRAISPATGQPYSTATVNRIMATVRHFGRWLHRQRPLLAGNPFENVKDVNQDEPDWNGLTDRQIMRRNGYLSERRRGFRKTRAGFSSMPGHTAARSVTPA